MCEIEHGSAHHLGHHDVMMVMIMMVMMMMMKQGWFAVVIKGLPEANMVTAPKVKVIL